MLSVTLTFDFEILGSGLDADAQARSDEAHALGLEALLLWITARIMSFDLAHTYHWSELK